MNFTIRWLLFLGLVVTAGKCMAADAKPNIVVLLIDDLGWDDFSCFGNQEVETPNVDRLAAEGLRFSQFYVNSPICSPSRTAILTGRYPQRYRIGSYLDNRQMNRLRGVADWLDPNVPTLARMLHDAGYTTGHFGKWHMGGQRDVGDAPLIEEYGFDESLTNFEGLGDRVLPLLIRPNQAEPQRHAIGSDQLGRGEITWRDRTEVTTAYVDAAIKFMDRAETENRPFYLNLWPDDMHSPLVPALDEWGDGSKRGLYLAVLKSMDRQLGKLFDHIRNSPELRDNTMIVVCSDNGPEPGAGSAGEFRGKKASLYEGGIRSPLTVWAPKWINPAAVGEWNRDSVIAAFDLAPSLLEIAEVEPAANAAFDGEVHADVLLGKSTASREAPLFFRRPPDRGQLLGQKKIDAPDLAMRSGKWKLLCEYDGSDPQLYDVVQDPRESNNLAEADPEVVAELTEPLLAWHAAMPADNGETFVAPQPEPKRR